jgi:cobalamin biosynthesis protein CobC
MRDGIFHGGRLDSAIAEFGGTRSGWLDLSTGINPDPWPLSPPSAQSWTNLPDETAQAELVEAARDYYRTGSAVSVIAAPGTQALIELLPRLLPGKHATIIATRYGTYGEHFHCCQKAGRLVRFVNSPDAVGDNDDLAILVNPNNPDGHIWSRADMAVLADKLGRNGGYVIIDEAFCDTDPQASMVEILPENMIVLRSFGKFFGLAGLRLGFAICSEDIAGRIEAWIGPWAVSGPALEIGAEALRDRSWIAQARENLAERSYRLSDILKQCGFIISGENSLFVLARHEFAAAIHRDLLRQHILVRAFADKPQYLRFGLPNRESEYLRLQQALSQPVAT